MSKVIPTLVGVPFSTFSRTMRMAFHHLNVEYKFEQAMPHSELAYKYNPFGRVPSLLHGDKAIFESSAIRDYVDTVYGDNLTPKDLDTRLKVDQMISALCDYIFHHVVFGVSKPREHFEKENKSEDEIAKLLQKRLQNAGKIIESFDSMIVEGPFLCGNTLTWADFFVYPAMADLYSLPEGKFIAEKAPKLFNWYKIFEKRQEAIDTFPDTVADIRSKKTSNL
jgi:glutathione S-transferase